MININLQNKVILIIEDSQLWLALIRAFFRNTGAVLLFATKGKSGWQMFIDNHVDLVILDLRLPEIEGLSLVSKMKQSKPDVPVIIQTACNLDFTEEECFDAGGDDYINKPYPRSVFMEVISKNIALKKTNFPSCFLYQGFNR